MDGTIFQQAMQDLQAKMMMKREELRVRLELAGITAKTRQQDSMTRTAVSLMQHDQKQQALNKQEKPQPQK